MKGLRDPLVVVTTMCLLFCKEKKRGLGKKDLVAPHTIAYPSQNPEIVLECVGTVAGE